MRTLLIVLSLLFCSASYARTEVGVSIGINVPAYPQLVAVPGYPVYYDPYADLNYFFYDGLYWVFLDDEWYESSWYNGPWRLVYAEDVPIFLLRVPVRYYRRPPAYFHGWYADAPPRWGEHWGHRWQQRRGEWERWDKRSTPSAAPLPSYQKSYSGERYPRAPEKQDSIRSEQYRYSPRDSISQQRFQPMGKPEGPRVDQQMQMRGEQMRGDKDSSQGRGRERGRGHDGGDKDRR